MKATNDQLLKSYATTKSVWKTAAVFGMCGQSVHERLSKLGVIQKAEFTDEDKAAIERVYQNGFRTGDGRLDLLATSIGHHKTNICRIARAMGLTNKSRRLSESQSRHLQGTCSQSRQKNGHPKGMLGKSHTQKVKGIIGAHSKATWHGRTPQRLAHSRSGRRENSIEGIKYGTKSDYRYDPRAHSVECSKLFCDLWRVRDGDAHHPR